MKKYFMVLFGVVLTSCATRYTEIQSTKIRATFIIHTSPTFDGYYYQGSDGEFHYFISKWKYSKNTPFKVKRSDLNVLEPYDFQSKEIRVSVIKTERIFSNGTIQLHIISTSPEL